VVFECPGSRKFRQPLPEFINCPGCGQEVEIWTDEVKATCPRCKKTVVRNQEESCLDWCEYARECVGEKTFENYMKNKSLTLKQQLMEELQRYFGDDKKRIEHAKKVMEHAGEILKREAADWYIVIPASLLHDVGVKAAREKYGCVSFNLQEKEGAKVARDILLKVGLKKEDIDEICQIIAYHHTPGRIETQNFKVLYDADQLVNLKDEIDLNDKEKLKKIIEERFLTDTGKELATRIYLHTSFTPGV
jgi:HD superfamily phosphodiesterase/predicted RNA-binding Zn-ribbon protein involved in translation (DUF1610 family)